MTVSNPTAGETWPSLSLEAWSDTYATLHLWTQIVGKIRLANSPWTNHSWHVTLYVTPRGLTTGSIPYGSHAFQIDFDFVEHELRIEHDRGAGATFPLERQSVAMFYRRLMDEMKKLDLKVRIDPKPNEIANPIPFEQDEVHASYDREHANRFWRVLLQSDRVFKIFRARFVGKCSPVHFFWGAPDLAVTRFSGRLAPPHPGGVPNLPDRVAREAYSYAYPEPEGFAQAPVRPAAAFYSSDLREFVFPYDEVRSAQSPDDVLLDFLQTTYEAAANLAKWDRATLEGLRYL